MHDASSGSARSSDVPEAGRRCGVELADVDVAVVRVERRGLRHQGHLLARRGRRCPRARSRSSGATIECWLHGSRFDLRTGEPTGLPATEPVAVYPVRVDGDDVLVDVDADDASDAASN